MAVQKVYINLGTMAELFQPKGSPLNIKQLMAKTENPPTPLEIQRAIAQSERILQPYLRAEVR